MTDLDAARELLAAPMTCRCEDIDMGSYANQEVIELPWGGIIGIDRCVLPEVRELWGMGIRTIESCCGHRKTVGYIAVRPEHEAAMAALGYVHDQRTEAPAVFEWPRAILAKINEGESHD